MTPKGMYHCGTRGVAALSLPVVAALVLGCDVENPGAILDKDLDNELVMQALVTGMSSDFSAGFDNIEFWIARGSDETTGSGSYTDTGLLRRGLGETDPDQSNGEWADAQRARWVAEQGLVRMQEVLGTTFEGNRLTARAYFLAALSNRVLGECFCEVTFDGGPLQPSTEAFNRAIPQAQEALRQAQLVTPVDSAITNLISATHGLLAQLYVGTGDWTNAAAEAALVATGFVYNAPYSDNSGRENNVLYTETHTRPEFSTYGTYIGSLGPSGDPRTPWVNANRLGADGVTPHWRQRKYTALGSDIPLVKGTDMRLIQAEARLMADDYPGAMTFINQVRTQFSRPALVAANSQEAWVHLDRERLLTLWLEGRRYFDLRRWDAATGVPTVGTLAFLPGVQYVNGGGTPAPVYSKDPSIAKRSTCIPVSTNECQTNPNLAGQCQ